MAINFNGSSEWLAVNQSILTGYPHTFVAWIKSDSLTVTQGIVGAFDVSVSNNYAVLNANGAFGGDPIQIVHRSSTGPNASSSTAYDGAGAWSHAAGVGTGASDRAAFVDGGSKGTNTTTVTPTGLDTFAIGRYNDSSPGTYFSGDIAEVAIYGVALADAEIALLAAGYSPLMVRPSDLLEYWPLRTVGELQGLINGHTLTVNGSPSTSDHPRVIMPRRRHIITAPAAAAAGGGELLTASQGMDGGFNPMNGGFSA